MELLFRDCVQPCMKRDGRTLAQNTLEEMRMLTVQRMNEGERPAAVTESFGMHRSWAFKSQDQTRGRGKGVRVLRHQWHRATTQDAGIRGGSSVSLEQRQEPDAVRV